VVCNQVGKLGVVRHCLQLLSFATTALLSQSQYYFANAQTTQRLLDLLPRETRDGIREAREWCEQAYPLGLGRLAELSGM
jgi:hypothetical protein